MVPKTSTTAQLTWSYRGFEAGLDVSTSSSTSTSITRSTEASPLTCIYDPPMLTDLALSYSFVDGGLPGMPAWAEDARVSL